MMFASCTRTAAFIAYLFFLIAGALAALSINDYNRQSDHAEWRTYAHYFSIGVIALISLLMTIVVISPFLKQGKAEKAKSNQKKAAKARKTLEKSTTRNNPFYELR